MKKAYSVAMIAIIAFMLTLSSCREHDSDVTAVPETGTATINGVVKDMNGATLAGVTVRSGLSEAVSGTDGTFELKDIKASDHVIVTFEKTQYMLTHKIAVTHDNRASWVDAAMSEIGNTAQIGDAGGNITDDGAQVTFPANAFADADGIPFSGQASVELTYCNPTDKFFCETFPGNFDGIREDGSETMIESFGFINVEIYDGNTKLELRDGVTADIKLPIPAALMAKAPNEIPLWNFDAEKGRWIEEGKALKTNGYYEGTVSHFSPWNCDWPGPRSYLKGRVVNQNGNPLPFAVVKSKGISYTGITQSQCNEDGIFKIPVLADARAALIGIYSGLFGEWAEFDTDPVEDNVKEIGDIVIDLSAMTAGGWIDVPLGKDYYFTAIDFLDDNTGWVLGKYLLHTSNGGKNWQEYSAPPIVNGKDSLNYTKMCFINETTGWILNYMSYKTTDAGKTWESFKIGSTNYFTGISFINEYTGWVCNGHNLWKTTDAGASWQALGQTPPQISTADMCFTDENTGYLMGYNNAYKTTDGGATWTEFGPDKEKAYMYNQILPVSDNTAFLLGRMNRGDGQYGLLMTTDAGATWTEQYICPMNLYSIYFVDDSNGWVVGESGTIVHTSDGGQSWKAQYSGVNVDLLDVEFIDALHGYVAGYHNTLLHTETGGEGE